MVGCTYLEYFAGDIDIAFTLQNVVKVYRGE